MTPVAALALAGCLAVAPDADEIRLRDLEPALDARGVAPETVIALAPLPGVQRRFEIAELGRIAARLHLGEPRRAICFERPVAPLDPARILAALESQLPEARIELSDYGHQPVPEGVLDFPLAGLRQTTGGGALWSGSIRYGGRHRLAVWARVKVSVAARRVVAATDLAAGRRIDAAALRVETREEFPAAGSFPTRLEEVAGKLPRRPVRAGMTIRSAWLEPARAVARGETVEVEVREGGALLRVPAQALASGAIGQTILLLNPESKRRFPARIEAPGKLTAGRGPL